MSRLRQSITTQGNQSRVKELEELMNGLANHGSSSPRKQGNEDSRTLEGPSHIRYISEKLRRISCSHINVVTNSTQQSRKSEITSAIAPLAQLDSAAVFYTAGWGFESLTGYLFAHFEKTSKTLPTRCAQRRTKNKVVAQSIRALPPKHPTDISPTL